MEYWFVVKNHIFSSDDGREICTKDLHINMYVLNGILGWFKLYPG